MKYLKVWTSFREVIQPLSDAEKGRLFEMMLLYADQAEEPADFTGNERFIWPAAKQAIDLMEERNEKLRQNGSKGGIARSRNMQDAASCSKIKQDEANASNVKQDEARSSLKEKKRKEKEIKEKDIHIPLARWTPPTVDEVREYCKSRGNSVDPEKWFDFYSSKGWMIGKNRMKDWRAAVRTWEKGNVQPIRTVTAQQYEQRNYDGVQDELIARQQAEMDVFLKGAG